jgi:glycosyltransferase involved in cell wall biosynthesis
MPGVQRLHDPPAVTVVGAVPTMESELARADVAVVPIRYGSGTRLKILESFAHRIPVVSTTLGAEGLDVRDGVHLLLADDPTGFAAAAARLLTDPDLRHSLVEQAERRYREHFESSVARDRIRDLALEVSGTAPADRT